MIVKEITDIHKLPMSLLLLADPSENRMMNYARKGICFGGYVEDELIGVYILLSINRTTIELMNIAVDERYQGRGYGKKLINHSISEAKKMGYQTLILGTGNSSIDQLAFYQKCGFRMTEIIKDHFTDHYDSPIIENGIECCDMVRLSLELKNKREDSTMNPILIDFPAEFTTDRLLIRMPKPGDGKVVHEAIMASLPELKPWLPFAQTDQTMADVEENIRESHVKFIKREDLRLLVFHKETGDFIASSGLHRMDWAVPKFEIGYWIDSRKSGKGYMTEAVDGIVKFAFMELHANRIEIRCDSRNQRSRAIPERLNFTLEGILRNEDVACGSDELRDTCVYAKLRDE